MDVAVVGPGAVGATIAAYLHAAGNSVRLCGRTPRDGIEVRPDAHIGGGQPIVVPGPVHTDPADVDRPVELVVLAVKATQVDAAAPWLHALCGPETVVGVFQNGIEQIELVGPHCPISGVAPAIVWFGAETQPHGWVRLRNEPAVTLPTGTPGEFLADVLRRAGCPVILAEDFNTAAWRKLLVNAAAGLMALTGRRMGMFRRDDVAALTRRYLTECVDVGRAERAYLPDDVVDEVVGAFAAGAPDGGTSILADREAHRPMEWDVRNGIISRMGREHGIATPISDILVPLLAATSDGPG
ncbi:MAG: oxidoreductase [Mycobacterium sp.]